jgi:hypothetical protein
VLLVDPDVPPPPPPRPPASYTVTLRLSEARDLPATDANGSLNPYATVELVDVLRGEPLATPRKHTTKTCRKTLHPVWHAECAWRRLDGEQPDRLALKVTVYDSDLGGLSWHVLGGFTVPLSRGCTVSGQRAQWYPLAAVGATGEAVASGQAKLEFSVADVSVAPPPPLSSCLHTAVVKVT